MLRKAIYTLLLVVATGVAAVAALLFVWPQFLPDTFPNPWARLVIEPLRGGVYWVRGGVSNTGFVIGDRGVVVIDPQMFPVTAKKLLRDIERLTSQPIAAIILTHSDPDHVNGLPGYPRGTTVIAHANTRADMLAALTSQQTRWISRPSAAVKDYLPSRLVTGREELELAAVRLVLLNFGPAHTDGDLIIYLPEQRIVFAGDLLAMTVGPYPGIHAIKRGNSAGWIRSVRAMLALDADVFVAGHGALHSRSDVSAALQRGEQRRSQIESLVVEGKSLDEVKQALGDKPPTGVARMFPTFTETTFDELVNGSIRSSQ
jgi:glyoxylase-like metal-dependent hydrolase (beta-lactamase superfamily II)